jgi:hypothetical protein
MYRTCLVLSGIQKKNALDDVFWMAVYNLCLSDMEGDMDRFYEVRCPQRFILSCAPAHSPLCHCTAPPPMLFGSRSPHFSACARRAVHVLT